METLPIYIGLVFGITLIAALVLLYKAAHSSMVVPAIISLWIALQSVVSITGFYTIEDTFPPRFALLILPPVLLIVVLFLTKSGRAFIDGLDIKMLTLLHIVRIPVEVVLFWLFMQKALPELMTFEGRNLDIISGISAPFVYYFTFAKKKTKTTFLLIWNFICLALLFNIVFYAVLSLPTAIQQFGFDQPNTALLYFPFVLLPSVLVPMVMFSHFAAIRKIIRRAI